MAKKPIRQKKQQGASSRTTDDLSLPSKVVTALFAAAILLILYWMIQSPRPYDDDSIDRYFMALAAPKLPDFFLSFWGRPLAILLYAGPAQFGYWFSAFVTVLLTAGTLYFTYQTAVARSMRNSWMVVPLLIAQPFFFITSFSLCTEPLAAFCLAWGMFLFEKKKTLPAVLVLSLVPLARSELVLALPIFAWLLFKEKKYVHILLLGSGLVVYQIAGMIATGDMLYLLSAGKSFAHGQYANGPFDHYFERFIFITGPVVFMFGLLRLAQDVRHKRLDVLNYILVVTLAIHVYLFWKGNVAHAGFLRHFVAIAPVIGLLALDGLNEWFRDDKPADKGFTLAVLAAGTVLVLLYYSVELFGNQALVNPATGQKQPEYMKFMIALLILILFVFNKFIGLRGSETKLVMLVSVMVSCVWYTTSKQKPLQLAPEQLAVREAHDFYLEAYKDKAPKTMVAHSWFFFFDNYNHYLSQFYEKPLVEMRKENLADLPSGSIVIWDSHYSWRLSSNVQQADLFNNDRFKLNREILSTDRRFGIYFFEKVK